MSKQDIGTTYVIIAFVMLTIPFGLLCLWTFRKLRSYIRTALNYSTFFLCSLIAFYTYFLLIGLLGFNYGSRFGSILGMTAYVVILCTAIPIAILAVATIIQTIIYFIAKRRKQKN